MPNLVFPWAKLVLNIVFSFTQVGIKEFNVQKMFQEFHTSLA